MKKLEKVQEIVGKIKLPGIEESMEDFMINFPSFRKPGWDNDRALPIEMKTVFMTLLFLKNLSEWIYNEIHLEIPKPYIDGLSSGDMSISFNKRKINLLIIVRTRGLFSCSGYLGNSIDDADFRIKKGFVDVKDFKQDDIMEFFQIYKENKKS